MFIWLFLIIISSSKWGYQESFNFFKRNFGDTRNRNKKKASTKQQSNNFLCTKTSQEGKIVYSAFSPFEISLWKSIEIVLIASFTILLMCTPFNPPLWRFFFTNLAPIFLPHLFIFICVQLFLFLKTSLLVFQNLFSSARISFYLSEPILICQNLISSVRISFYF